MRPGSKSSAFGASPVPDSSGPNSSPRTAMDRRSSAISCTFSRSAPSALFTRPSCPADLVGCALSSSGEVAPAGSAPSVAPCRASAAVSVPESSSSSDEARPHRPPTHFSRFLDSVCGCGHYWFSPQKPPVLGDPQRAHVLRLRYLGGGHMRHLASAWAGAPLCAAPYECRVFSTPHRSHSRARAGCAGVAPRY